MFKAAAKAVRMQCNISLHEMTLAALIYFPLHFIVQYLFFISLDHGAMQRWHGGCPFALSRCVKVMEITNCHPKWSGSALVMGCDHNQRAVDQGSLAYCV